MATAKSCEELQLIGILNNTFKVQAGNGTVSTFCGESGNYLFSQYPFYSNTNTNIIIKIVLVRFTMFALQ